MIIIPKCPKCGAVLEEGSSICSCGNIITVSVEDELEHLLTVEAQKVEKFRELKAKCLEAFESEDYESSFNYSSEALDLGIGSDAELSFARGKSLFYMNRFLDSANCFSDYIAEYEDSFYRYSNISWAYEWKAAALWQLGDGFGSIKCYYKALDHVENKQCSNEEKMNARSRIIESRRRVMLASNTEGIANPKLGDIDEKVYDRLEELDPDINVTMQNLYDAIDAAEGKGCIFKSLFLADGEVHVEFSRDGESLRKCFDGTSTFK